MFQNAQSGGVSTTQLMPKTSMHADRSQIYGGVKNETVTPPIKLFKSMFAAVFTSP
jgi:hypothetical protein